jgi:hypothetical protein
VFLFQPTITVTACFSSDFSFEIHAEVKGLPPNEVYELWTFSPDGEAIGGQGLKSDEYGNPIELVGRDIAIGHSSSAPIQKGNYIFGIVRGHFIFTKKPYFTDWNNQRADKSHISFKIPHQNESSIDLDEVGEVPWGSHVVLNGKVSTRGHASAPNMYLGKKISFTGTGEIPSSTTANGSGVFSSVFKVEDNLSKSNQIQAIFEGDEHYSKSISDPVSYNTPRCHFKQLCDNVIKRISCES